MSKTASVTIYAWFMARDHGINAG